MENSDGLKWEVFDPGGGEEDIPTLYRTAIFGGWLLTPYSNVHPVALTFVPDPQHQWDGKNADTTRPPDYDEYLIYAADFKEKASPYAIWKKRMEDLKPLNISVPPGWMEYQTYVHECTKVGIPVPEFWDWQMTLKALREQRNAVNPLTPSLRKEIEEKMLDIGEITRGEVVKYITFLLAALDASLTPAQQKVSGINPEYHPVAYSTLNALSELTLVATQGYEAVLEWIRLHLEIEKEHDQQSP